MTLTKRTLDRKLIRLRKKVANANTELQSAITDAIKNWNSPFLNDEWKDKDQSGTVTYFFANDRKHAILSVDSDRVIVRLGFLEQISTKQLQALREEVMIKHGHVAQKSLTAQSHFILW